jgi:LysR family nitrogen assimilation transcriptional regulator
VLYNPDQSSDLEMSTLHEDELVLISPASAEPAVKAAKAGKASKAIKATESVSLASVAELDLILPSRPNAFRILLEGEMMTLGKRPNVIYEVDGLNAILSLVKEGVGHAVLPSYTLSNFENSSPFAIKAIHSPSIKSQLMLVWSSRRPTTQTQKRAMQIVSQVVLQAIDR